MLNQNYLNHYIELLIDFNNKNLAIKKLRELKKITYSKERKIIIDNFLNEIKKINTIGGINGIIVLQEGNETYPIIFPIVLEYDKNINFSYNLELENLIRNSTNLVENYFAKKNIFLDINPHNIYIHNIDKLEKYILNINSISLALSIAVFSFITNTKIPTNYFFSGGIDYKGLFIPATMIKEKIKVCSSKDTLIIPRKSEIKDIKGKTNIIKVQSFDYLINLLYKSKPIKPLKTFYGSPYRIFSIAEIYLQKENDNAYLPLYLNLEIYLKNKKQSELRNLYFLTLMRLAMHYNQAGKQEIAYKYFNNALKVKEKLIKDHLFEINNLSFEFNNIYAVFLKDIYRYKESLNLLKENLKEKEITGKHLYVSTAGSLAQLYIQLRKYKKSEKLLKNNLKIIKKHLPRDLSRTYCYLAKLETLRKNYDKSKYYIQKAKNFKKFSNVKIQDIFIYFEELRYYCKTKQEKYFKKTLNKLTICSIGTKYSYMISLSYLMIGEYYINTNKEKSLKYLYNAKNELNKKSDDYKILLLKSFSMYYLKYNDKYILSQIKDIMNKIKFLNKEFKIIKGKEKNIEKQLKNIIKRCNIV